MDIALWVAQILLGLVFLMAGGIKLAKSREELVEQMGWVEDFSDGAVKAIGGIEVLAAIGLIAPAVTGIAPILVPISAAGLAVAQAVAAVMHARRGGEGQMIITNVVLIAMAAFVAWGRFGDYPL